MAILKACPSCPSLWYGKTTKNCSNCGKSLRGTLKWKAVRRVAGVQRSKSAYTSRELALRYDEEMKKCADLGLTLPWDKKEPGQPTFGELVSEYRKKIIEPRKKASGGKDTDKRGMHIRFWSDHLGPCTHLVNITKAMIQKGLDFLQSENPDRAPATINKYRQHLSHTLNMAVEWDWLVDNPCARVKKLTEARGRVRYLEPDEIPVVLEASKTHPHPDLYLAVLLALSTGMRRGEAINLTGKDVDLRRNWLVLRDTKNGETRGVPLNPEVKGILEKRLKVVRIDNPKILTIHPDTLTHYFKKLMLGIGIDDFHFHDLRHTAASYLAMNGASLLEIRDLLGHKSFKMVGRYAHLSQDHLRGVMDKGPLGKV